MPAGNPIDASSRPVADVLAAITQAVLQSGGYVHPSARIVERSGALSVHCPHDSSGGRDGEPLIEVPRQVLIPMRGAVWADSAYELRLIEYPVDITPLQRDLLDMMVELFNATKKIPLLVASHPRVAFRDHHDVVGALQALRPEFGRTWDSAAEVFWSTRVLSNPPQDGRQVEARGSVSVLLPLVDALNHHPRGASLSMGRSSLSVSISRPERRDECFAHYGGARDPIDLALGYGYFDGATRSAWSAPVNVTVPGVGGLRVMRNLPNGVHPLAPPLIARAEHGLVLSHLVFVAGDSDRVRTYVKMALKAHGLNSGASANEARHAADGGAELVVAANMSALEQVLRALEAVPDSAATQVVSNAVRRQSTIFQT